MRIKLHSHCVDGVIELLLLSLGMQSQANDYLIIRIFNTINQEISLIHVANYLIDTDLFQIANVTTCYRGFVVCQRRHHCLTLWGD